MEKGFRRRARAASETSQRPQQARTRTPPPPCPRLLPSSNSIPVPRPRDSTISHLHFLVEGRPIKPRSVQLFPPSTRLQQNRPHTTARRRRNLHGLVKQIPRARPSVHLSLSFVATAPKLTMSISACCTIGHRSVWTARPRFEVKKPTIPRTTFLLTLRCTATIDQLHRVPGLEVSSARETRRSLAGELALRAWLTSHTLPKSYLIPSRSHSLRSTDLPQGLL